MELAKIDRVRATVARRRAAITRGARRGAAALALVVASALLAACTAHPESPAKAKATASATATATATATTVTVASGPENIAPGAWHQMPPPPGPPAAPPGAGVGPKPLLPFAVTIGNNPRARPQSGLQNADIVWEILAEGLITRYFAIFDSTGAGQVGPIRSTRIYFDQLARAYNIPLAHAGGNVDALNAAARWHLKNLDEIYTAGGFFWRGSARTPPNNLYTSTALMNDADRYFHFSAPALKLPARGPLPSGMTPIRGVSLTYIDEPGIYTYIAGWRWSSGWWWREHNGQPYRTLSGTQIRAGTVIILDVPVSPDPDPHTPGAIKMDWGAGGRAWVLRQGGYIAGTWRMGANGLPEVLRNGRPLPAGTRLPYWYELVPTVRDVAFSRR